MLMQILVATLHLMSLVSSLILILQDGRVKELSLKATIEVMESLIVELTIYHNSLSFTQGFQEIVGITILMAMIQTIMEQMETILIITEPNPFNQKARFMKKMQADTLQLLLLLQLALFSLYWFNYASNTSQTKSKQ